MNVVFLLACHNRKEKTLLCIKNVFTLDKPNENTSISVILVDDGSTDGTSALVKDHFPKVKILYGDGSLYWNGGMRMAFQEAIQNNYDYYVWLNDDTTLFPDALVNLISTHQRLEDEGYESAIIVGSTKDKHTHQHTYGGYRRTSKLRPLNFSLIQPENRPLPCDTMNGNCVLIPDIAAKTVGNLDQSFTHALGDFDYGLKAKKKGCSVWVAPGYVGVCSHNPISGSFRDPNLPIRARMKKLLSFKGLPPKEWLIYARRYAGFFWPFYWLSPYLRYTLKFIQEAHYKKS